MTRPSSFATDRRLIGHLSTRLSQAAPLRGGERASAAFQRWHAQTTKTLEAIFGMESPTVTDFAAFLTNDEDPEAYLRTLHQLLVAYDHSGEDDDAFDKYDLLKSTLSEFKRGFGRFGEESFVQDSILEKQVRRRVLQTLSVIYSDVHQDDAATGLIQVAEARLGVQTHVVTGKQSYLRVRDDMLACVQYCRARKDYRRLLVFIYDPLFFMKNPFSLIGEMGKAGPFGVDLIISPQPFVHEGQ